jgi:hypothetical protein
MTGFLGAGGWSDGKLTYHTAIGGQLSKYVGEKKAMALMGLFLLFLKIIYRTLFRKIKDFLTKSISCL